MKPQTQRRASRLLLLLLWLGTLSLLATEPQDTRRFARDTSGKAPVTLTEVWRVGEDAGDAALWTSPDTRLSVDQQQRVWVADLGANQLNLFSADGTFVRTISAKGPAPHELRGVKAVHHLADGTALVLDQSPMGMARLLHFQEDGGFIKMQPFRSLRAIPMSLAPAPDGSRLAGLFMGIDTAKGKLMIESRLFDAALKPQKTFVSTAMTMPSAEIMQNRKKLQAMVADVLGAFYRGQGLVTYTTDGHLASAATNSKLIQRYDASGEKILWRVAVDGAPIHVSEQERAHMAEVLLEELRGQGGLGSLVNEQVIAAAMDEAEIPTVKNPLFGLLPAGEHLLAVYDLSFGNSEQAADVLSHDGRYLGSLRRGGAPFLAPTSNLTPRMVFHGDSATTLEQDDEGGLSLVRYRLTWH